MPQEEEDEEEESQEDYVTQFDDPVDIDPISEGAMAAAVEGQEYSQDELLEMGKLWFSYVTMVLWFGFSVGCTWNCRTFLIPTTFLVLKVCSEESLSTFHICSGLFIPIWPRTSKYF